MNGNKVHVLVKVLDAAFVAQQVLVDEKVAGACSTLLREDPIGGVGHYVRLATGAHHRVTAHPFLAVNTVVSHVAMLQIYRKLTTAAVAIIVRGHKALTATPWSLDYR